VHVSQIVEADRGHDLLLRDSAGGMCCASTRQEGRFAAACPSPSENPVARGPPPPDHLALLRLSLGVLAHDLGRPGVETHPTYRTRLGHALYAPAADDYRCAADQEMRVDAGQMRATRAAWAADVTATARCLDRASPETGHGAIEQVADERALFEADWRGCPRAKVSETGHRMGERLAPRRGQWVRAN